MSIDNPGQSNPLRSVTAGKYVRYLTHETISGEPYYFPHSLPINKFSNSTGPIFRNDRVKNEFSLLKLIGGSLESISTLNLSPQYGFEQ